MPVDDHLPIRLEHANGDVDSWVQDHYERMEAARKHMHVTGLKRKPSVEGEETQGRLTTYLSAVVCLFAVWATKIVTRSRISGTQNRIEYSNARMHIVQFTLLFPWRILPKSGLFIANTYWMPKNWFLRCTTYLRIVRERRGSRQLESQGSISSDDEGDYLVRRQPPTLPVQEAEVPMEQSSEEEDGPDRFT